MTTIARPRKSTGAFARYLRSQFDAGGVVVAIVFEGALCERRALRERPMDHCGRWWRGDRRNVRSDDDTHWTAVVSHCRCRTSAATLPRCHLYSASLNARSIAEAFHFGGNRRHRRPQRLLDRLIVIVRQSLSTLFRAKNNEGRGRFGDFRKHPSLSMTAASWLRGGAAVHWSHDRGDDKPNHRRETHEPHGRP